ncbi:sugar phosphate nucleotidyltransferase, partial [Chloroflexota bacterium]
MKVVIFAGGRRGIRLREDTEYRPKALAPIGGYPIVWHIMNLYSHYGYNDFILLLGPDNYKIKNYFLSYNEMIMDFTLELGSLPELLPPRKSNALRNWKISFVDTGVTMTGESLAQAEPLIDKGSNFFLTYCDTISNVNIADLKRFHEAIGRVVTITGAHPSFPLGIVEAQDGLVTTFREKKNLEGLVNGGFFVCDSRI